MQHVEENVLHAVDRNLGTNVRALAFAAERFPITVHRVLQVKALHPFI